MTTITVAELEILYGANTKPAEEGAKRAQQSMASFQQAAESSSARASTAFERTRTSLGQVGKGADTAASQANAAMDRMASKAQQTGNSLKQSLAAGFAGGVAAAATAKAGDLLASAFDKAKGAIIDYNVQVDQASVAFRVMETGAQRARGEIVDVGKATEAANQHLADLVQFGKTTPFELGDLTKQSTRLQAFGFAAKDVIPILKAVGDQAAAMPGNVAVNADRLSLALGQIQAKGKASGDELMQLTEAGVPALQALAKWYGKTTAETQDMVEKGMIPAKEAISAILSDMQDRVGGMMDETSKNLPTAISNINDSINSLVGGAFKPLTNLLTEAAVGFADLLGSDAVKAWFDGLGVGVQGTIDGLKGFWGILQTVAGGLGDLFGPVGEWLGGLVDSFTHAVEPAQSLGMAAGDLETAFASFADAGSEVQDTLANLTGIFSEVELAGNNATDMFGGLREMAKGAGEVFAVVTSLAGGFIKVLTGEMDWSEFTDNATGAFDMIRQGYNDWYTGLHDILDSAIATLTDWGRNLGDQVKEWAPVLWEWIKEVTPQVIDAVAGLTGDIASAIVSMAGDLTNALYTWAAGFVEWVAPMIPDLLNALLDVNLAIFNFIKDHVPDLLNQLGEWGQSFADWVGPAVPPLLEALGHLAAQIGDWALHDALPRFVELLGSWKDSFVDWVPQAAEGVAAALPGIGDAISSFFQEMIPKAGAWAAALGNSIVGVFGQIVGRIGQLFSTLGAAKDAAMSGNFDSAADIAKGAFGGLTGDIGASIASVDFGVSRPAGGGGNKDARPLSGGDFFSNLFPGGGGLFAPRPAGDAGAQAPRSKEDYANRFGANRSTQAAKGAGGGGGGGKGKDLSKETQEEFYKRVLGYGQQLAEEFKRRGVRDQDIPALVGGALAIADNESFYKGIRFNPEARRTVPGKEDAYGLFQIDTIAGKFAGMPGEPFLDPSANIKGIVERYLYPAYKQGARTGGDLYYAPNTLGINAGDTTPGLRQKFDEQTTFWANLLQGANPDLFEKGKKGKAFDMGDPLAHGAELIGRGVDALKKLSTDYTPADTRQVEQFFGDLVDVTKAMSEASTKAEELLAGNEAKLDLFAEYAGGALDLVTKGVDAFTKLADLVPPTDADLANLFGGIDKLVAAVTDRAGSVKEDLLAGAENFVTVAGDAYALLSAGVDSFNKLADLQPIDAGAIDTFFTNLDTLLASYKARLGTFGEDLQQQSVAFLRVASDAAGTVVKGAEAFNALLSTPVIDAGTIDTFVGSIDGMVRRFAAAGALVDNDLLKQAARFNTAVSSATKGVKEGVDALNALWRLEDVNAGDVDRFVASIATMVNRFADGFNLIGGTGGAGITLRKHATDFAATVGTVTGPLKAGIEGLNSLWRIEPVDTADVDRFVAGVSTVVRGFATVDPQIRALGNLAGLFGETVGKVTGPLKNAVEGLGSLWKFEAPDPEQVRALITSLTGLVGGFAAAGVGFRAGQLEGAANFAGAANAAAGAIKSGLDAFRDLHRFSAPSDDLLGNFTTTVRQLVGHFAEAATLIGTRGVESARAFGEAAKVSVDAAAGGLKLFEDLRYYRPRELPLGDLMTGVESIVSVFRVAGAALTEREAGEAQRFATTAAGVAGALSTSVDAFGKMADLVIPTGPRLAAASVGMGQLVGFSAQLGAFFDQTQTDDASRFADAAGKSASAYSSALAAFASLQDFVRPSDTKIAEAFASLKLMATEFLGLSQAWDSQNVDLTRLAQTGDAIGKVVAPLGNALTAFNQLLDFEAPSGEQISALVGGIGRVVREYSQQVMPLLTSLPPGQTQALAALSGVVDTIGKGAEVLGKLSTLELPTGTKIGETVARVFGDLVGTALPELRSLASANYAGFDKAAQSVLSAVDIVAKGTETFVKLASLPPINGNAIADVFSGIRVAVGEFGALLGEMSISSRLATNAGRADSVITLLGSAIEPLTKLGTYLSPSGYSIDHIAEDIKRLVGAVGGALGEITVATSLDSKLKGAQDALTTVGSAVDVIGKLQTLFSTTGGVTGHALVIKSVPPAVIDSVIANVKAVVTGVEGALSQLGFGAGGDTQSTNGRLSAINSFMTAVGGIGSAASSFFGAFNQKDISSSGIASTLKLFTGSLSGLLDIVSGVAGRLDDSAFAKLTGVTREVSGLFGQFANLANSVKGVSTNNVFGFVATFKDAFVQILESLGSIADSEAGTKTLAGLNEFLRRLTGLFMGDAGFVAGRTFAEQLAAGIQAGLADVGSTLTASITKLVGTPVVVQGFTDAGVQLGNTVETGVLAGFKDDLKDSLAEMGKALRSEAQSFAATPGNPFTQAATFLKGTLPAEATKGPTPFNDFIGGTPADFNRVAGDMGDLKLTHPAAFNAGSFNPITSASSLYASYSALSDRQLYELAVKLGIPFHVTSYDEPMTKAFREQIIQRMIAYAFTGFRTALGTDSPFGDPNIVHMGGKDVPIASFDTGAAKLLTDRLAMVHTNEAIIPLDQFPDLIAPALQPIVTKTMADAMPAGGANGINIAEIVHQAVSQAAVHFGDAMVEAISEANFHLSFGEHQIRAVVQDAQRKVSQGQY